MKYDPLCPTVLDQDELVNVVFAFCDFDHLSNAVCKRVLNAGYEGISLLSVVKLRIRILIFSCMLAKLK